MNEKVGILHPGQMGISIAASVKNSGYEVFWSSEGRSEATRLRAESQRIIEMPRLVDLCETCSVLISVCPPHAAETVADEALNHDFEGLYLDANAISPERAIRIWKKMAGKGVDFVDGGIIGGPAWEPYRTWMYLSGKEALRAAMYFSGGPLETEVLGEDIGAASSLKMCFAAYTKGSTALLGGILAAAERLGVRQNLERQWNRGGGDFAGETRLRMQRVSAKAWRFSGEMEEIAATMSYAGLPDGFHKSAAEIYQRIAHFKGLDELPSIKDVLEALLKSR
jgi:3-hydroxyisobutyrate dehydrogenase-like beta-hydroxyacid dehydrogenase